MKKAKILLAMLLALSVFTFAGCGGDNNADDSTDNGTTMEETTDNAGQDLKDDAEDLGNDLKDGAEDMLDGTDDANNNKDNTDKNKDSETK